MQIVGLQKVKRLLAVLSVFLFSNQAHAEYSTFGAGNVDCQTYLDNYNDETLRPLFDQYVFGYLTGMNALLETLNQMNNTDTPTNVGEGYQSIFMLEIYKHCEFSPQRSFQDAFDLFLARLLDLANE
jgi:hypothetical protein